MANHPRHDINEFLFMQSQDFKQNSADRRAFTEIRNLILSLDDSDFAPFHFDSVREVISR